jgi:hypothetical protein
MTQNNSNTSQPTRLKLWTREHPHISFAALVIGLSVALTTVLVSLANYATKAYINDVSHDMTDYADHRHEDALPKYTPRTSAGRYVFSLHTHHLLLQKKISPQEALTFTERMRDVPLHSTWYSQVANWMSAEHTSSWPHYRRIILTAELANKIPVDLFYRDHLNVSAAWVQAVGLGDVGLIPDGYTPSFPNDTSCQSIRLILLSTPAEQLASNEKLQAIANHPCKEYPGVTLPTS